MIIVTRTTIIIDTMVRIIMNIIILLQPRYVLIFVELIGQGNRSTCYKCRESPGGASTIPFEAWSRDCEQLHIPTTGTGGPIELRLGLEFDPKP